uniref:Uncharacterized protein n=1 Tax=viral metagenome TaxID=1070528 RepID=A0A6C0CSM1_9ZZZZ
MDAAVQALLALRQEGYVHPFKNLENAVPDIRREYLAKEAARQRLRKAKKLLRYKKS